MGIDIGNSLDGSLLSAQIHFCWDVLMALKLIKGLHVLFDDVEIDNSLNFTIDGWCYSRVDLALHVISLKSRQCRMTAFIVLHFGQFVNDLFEHETSIREQISHQCELK
jgi:hypothetical protein